MDIMTHDEFRAKNPAPGTKFVELGSISEVIAYKIDPETQDPDDITAVRVSDDPEYAEMIGVISWGSWEGHEEILDQHRIAVEMMENEDPSFTHVCEIGITAK